MAQRVSQLPNIAAVRGITRPDGKPLDQAKLSYQAGQVGDALHGASTQITDKTNDLDALTNGADKLASTLASVRDQVNSASGSISGMASTLSQVQGQLGTAANLVDSIRGMANSSASTVSQATGMVDQVQAALNGPQCDANPLCSAGRSELAQIVPAGSASAPAVPNVLSAVQNLSGQLETAINNLRAATGGGAAKHPVGDFPGAERRRPIGRRQRSAGRGCAHTRRPDQEDGRGSEPGIRPAVVDEAGRIVTLHGGHVHPEQGAHLGRLQEGSEAVHLARRALGALPRRDEVRPVQHGRDGPGSDDPGYGAGRSAEHDAVRCDDIDGRNHPDVQRHSQQLRP